LWKTKQFLRDIGTVLVIILKSYIVILLLLPLPAIWLLFNFESHTKIELKRQKTSNFSFLLYDHLNQNLKYYRDNYPHRKGMTFSDFSYGHEEFSVKLVGLNYYYTFVTGEVVKGGDSPIAVKSKLGWILSGGNFI